MLDPHTINQIAAGEVIERPSSVVKELVENSIDSGATWIEIELNGSGKELIRVSDNGCGMTAEDAELALERHATSKIRSAGDLFKATSLGFRGEALPSIASVSKMTLSTSTNDESRLSITVDFGKKGESIRHAGPKGTDVKVENLFGNTPARLKFLKSDSTESSAVIDLIGKYAIAHPHIKFLLRFGNHEALRTSGNGDILEALTHVWGSDISKALAEIDTTINGIRVQGFVGPPYVNKANRNHQIIFVNGRPVRSKTIYASLDAAFRSLTPERRYCIAVIILSIDPSDVDINMSPTKSEVKFQRESVAFDAVRMAIKSALMQHGLMPSALPEIQSKLLVNHEAYAVAAMPNFQPSASREGLFFDETLPQPGPRYPFAELLQDLEVLGQVDCTFIVAKTRRGIVIIDQHVAHERVLYEYICGIKGNSAIESQTLLIPVTIEFDRAQAKALCERIDDLKSVGFEIEPFGGADFIIRSVPAAAAERDYRKLLREIADELLVFGSKLKHHDARERVWIMSACRMAVKAGDVLSIPEMEKLIFDLAETENPYLCPHGRPITVTVTIEELMRRFKRA